MWFLLLLVAIALLSTGVIVVTESNESINMAKGAALFMLGFATAIVAIYLMVQNAGYLW